jgi:LPS-assembly lipoprotein
MHQKSEIRNQKSEHRTPKRLLTSVFCVLISAVSASALTACGFHPLYGTLENGAPGVDLSTIYVNNIPERVGYQLRNDLLDLFNNRGVVDGAKYRLDIVLKADKVALGFLNNAEITRYNYYLSAHYNLVSLTTNKAVKRGIARIITSYNVVTSPYATVVAEKDAQDRAARDIAETIRTEISVYLREAALHPNAQPAPDTQPEPDLPEPIDAVPSQTP